MAAKQQDIVLRVFMEQTGGVWEAICVDLDIAAQGSSRTETLGIIEDMISSYLEAMNDYSPEERKRFLNRKSPLSIRASWVLKIFVASFFANRSRGDKMSVLSHHHCPA